MENRDIQYLRKFLSWCFALESLLTALYFHRRILFMIRHPYFVLPLRAVLDAAFCLVVAAVLGVAWWVVWKGKTSARNWGIAASLTSILIFLESIAFRTGSIWGRVGGLMVGTIGMVLFWRRDQEHDPRLPMKAKPASARITWVAGITALVGPACAVLPYTDYLPAFASSALAVVWLLAALGAIGIGIGVFAFCKGSKIAGTVCFLTNIPVFAYYGFIAVFFAMGGSR